MQDVHTFFRSFMYEVTQKQTLLSAMTAHVQSFYERVLQQQLPSVSLLARLSQLFVYLRCLLRDPGGNIDEAILLIYIIVSTEVRSPLLDSCL